MNFSLARFQPGGQGSAGRRADLAEILIPINGRHNMCKMLENILIRINVTVERAVILKIEQHFSRKKNGIRISKVLSGRDMVRNMLSMTTS